MLLIKSLHIIFVVTWFAGLFYLPRLFVYHAMCEDEPGNARFKIMERKLAYGIMTPSAVLAVAFGVMLWLGYGFGGVWLFLKSVIVAMLIVYHGWCLVTVRVFRDERNERGHRFYRWMNELPVLALVVIVILAVYKPV